MPDFPGAGGAAGKELVADNQRASNPFGDEKVGEKGGKSPAAEQLLPRRPHPDVVVDEDGEPEPLREVAGHRLAGPAGSREARTTPCSRLTKPGRPIPAPSTGTGARAPVPPAARPASPPSRVPVGRHRVNPPDQRFPCQVVQPHRRLIRPQLHPEGIPRGRVEPQKVRPPPAPRRGRLFHQKPLFQHPGDAGCDGGQRQPQFLRSSVRVTGARRRGASGYCGGCGGGHPTGRGSVHPTCDFLLS